MTVVTCGSGGGVTKDEYVMTIVDLNNLGYRDELFVLAQYVAQVFYIKDMSSKPKKGINKQKNEPKRHIILSVIPPFELDADPCILLANDDAPYLRRDHNQGIFVKRKSVTANPSCTCHFILLYKNVIAIRILLLYMYCTIILYVLYIYHFLYFSLNPGPPKNTFCPGWSHDPGQKTLMSRVVASPGTKGRAPIYVA